MFLIPISLVLILFLRITVCTECFVYIDEFTKESYIAGLKGMIEKCNYTLTNITIVNSKIKSTNNLNTVKHINPLPGGYAIFITNNDKLYWHEKSFGELLSIKTRDVTMKEATLITIDQNLITCVLNSTRQRFQLAMGANQENLIHIQYCMCATSTVNILNYPVATDLVDFSEECEIIIGDLFLTSENVWNPYHIEYLYKKFSNVWNIYGRLQVSDTPLENLTFLENLNYLGLKNPPFNYKFYAPEMSATFSIYNNPNLKSLGLKNLKEIFPNRRFLYTINHSNNEKLKYTDHERKLMQRFTPDVVINEFKCGADVHSTKNLHITEKYLAFYSNCTIIAAPMIIFDDNSPSEEKLMNNVWLHFVGCVRIHRTNYTSLDFLRSLASIECSYTNEVPALDIYDNPFLRTINIDAVILRRGHFDDNRTHTAVRIYENKVICRSSATQLDNQLNVYNPLDPSVMYDVMFEAIASNETCNVNFKHEDSVIGALMMFSLLLSIIAVGLIYIFNST